MSGFKCVLDKEHNVVPCEDDDVEWDRIFSDDSSRRVGLTVVDGYIVSTVFLGINHRLTTVDGDGPPIVFETMIFKGDSNTDLYMDRYCTWDEAVKGHEVAVQLVKDGKITDEEKE